MFIGHGLLAFALAAGLAHRAERSRERALSIGLVAGAFATVPDVDMLYAASGLIGGFDGAADAVGEFWSASTLVHRAVTHSIVVGVVSAVGFALWSRAITRKEGQQSPQRWTKARMTVRSLSGLVVLVSLIVTAGLTSGWLGLVVMAAFAVTGLAVATAAVRLGDLGPRTILATALLGLVSHPFGDLFTGEPPQFFYPFGIQPVAERVALTPDPTLHLLGAFGIELATIWIAAIVYCHLTDRSVRRNVHWRAAFGIAYAGAALALPAPTVDSSYRFVVSVLAVGIVGPAPLVRWMHPRHRRTLGSGQHTARHDTYARIPIVDEVLSPMLTGLAAITLAGSSFGVVYAVI